VTVVADARNLGGLADGVEVGSGDRADDTAAGKADDATAVGRAAAEDAATEAG
jgi:hypothetical protein